MQESIDLLVGDVFLGAACIAYYGAFPGDFRQELLSGWVEQCKRLGIPVTHDCTLRGVLASPIQVTAMCNCTDAVVLYNNWSVSNCLPITAAQVSCGAIQ